MASDVSSGGQGAAVQARALARPAPRVVCFGECMLELQGQAFGTMQQGYGGDTLNTAVYLARCGAAQGVAVDYATALGDDPLSDGLISRWAAEGLGTGLVRRLPGALPGLYLIEVDARGERRFSYWRGQAAARRYFDTADGATPLEQQLAQVDWLYLSGISLAILPPAGRQRLYALMARLRAAGGRVVFDNNHRPRLWPDAATARQAQAQALAQCDIALVTLDDHLVLSGPADTAADAAAALAQLHALPVAEVVVKRGAAPTLLRLGSAPWQAAAVQPVAQVVDTTAAGDSFGAGYLARRLAGDPPAQAAEFGNRLAARVIQHRGAVIASGAMADLLAPTLKPDSTATAAPPG